MIRFATLSSRPRRLPPPLWLFWLKFEAKVRCDFHFDRNNPDNLQKLCDSLSDCLFFTFILRSWKFFMCVYICFLQTKRPSCRQCAAQFAVAPKQCQAAMSRFFLIAYRVLLSKGSFTGFYRVLKGNDFLPSLRVPVDSRLQICELKLFFFLKHFKDFFFFWLYFKSKMNLS